VNTSTDHPKHILVTGCAGFIASKVCEFLLANGHIVVGVDNMNDAYDIRLKHWRLAQVKKHPGFSFHQLDISNKDEVQTLFQVARRPNQPSAANFDAIINLAARAGVRQSVADPWVYYETNVTGTLNLLEICRTFDIRKFVLASTSSLYGIHNPQPFSEDANTDGPLSPYAASKKAAETLCYTYHHLHAIDVTVLRYFTVYGPAGRPDMSLFRFVQWISEGRPVTVYGDGQQSRDFTYVDDIARGTIAGLKPLGYEVINLGSDMPVVLMDAIRLIEQQVGNSAKLEMEPRHPADMPATWADIHKAERLLGWRPQCTFEAGVGQLVAWYHENRDWASQINTG
jgi:nucleoside-diphosphate-sugar epimerase